MGSDKIRVLQFICPVGFYGAERWILALVNNSDNTRVSHDLVVTEESSNQDLEIVNQFPLHQGEAFKVPMTSRFDWSAINKLVDIIKRREIDIIHTHGYKSDILGLIAARRAGIKAVSTPHGFGIPNDFKLKMFVKLGSYALRFFDRVVPLSHQLEQEVLQFGVAPQKISYVRNGVDLTEVDHYREQEIERDDDVLNIGFIGQMIPRKNIRDILDTFEQVHQQLPNARLQLLGDGESRAELEAHAATLSSRNAIHFLGFRNDRMDYLRRFHLFVMTSRDEGIPRCLMEAMAMEIPVVAYDIAGIDQLVEHQKTGLLSSFADRDSLAKQWLLLLNNPAKAKQLAEAGRKYVNDRFSGKRMASEYIRLFSELVELRH